jgi:hypothetical protein
MGSRRVDAAIWGYFLLASVWLTWPLLPRMTTALSSSPDSLLNAWALGWSFHILPRDPFALFDANIFFPRPDTLAYSEHLFGITVLVWPVFALTGNLALAYNVAVLSSFALSGAGMYLLVREITGSRWAGLLSGTIFLAAPYRFGHLLQLQLLTLQWLPFAFWCALRFLREGRKRQLAGIVAFSALQALSCNYYMVYLALAMALFGASLAVSGRDFLDRRKIALFALGAAAVITLCLPFLVPYTRNRERGFYRRYEDVVYYSASLSDYSSPSRFNRPPYERWVPSQSRPEKALLPGFGAVALALIGIAVGRGRNHLFWLFCIALTVTAVVLSLGPELRWGNEILPLPYRFFYRHVPGFDSIRVPARISVLALFGIAVLAGLGASVLSSKMSKRKNAFAIALLGLLLLEYRTYSLESVFPEAPAASAAHLWLAQENARGGILVLPIHEGREIIHESLALYHSMAHFQPLVNGYSGWWPNDYWELVGRLRHFPTARSLRFLLERAPVRYVVVQYDRIPEPRRRELERGMERYGESMPLVFRLGDEAVYEIRERADPS